MITDTMASDVIIGVSAAMNIPSALPVIHVITGVSK
jgi:hypothetical protein